MIWYGGHIIPDHALRIDVHDRVFEHGLGLFETFRTWNGRPTLLTRHLQRISRSARELDIPFNDDGLPDARDIRDLIAASRNELGSEEEVRLRLTLTGGLSTAPPSASVLWMTVKPLLPPVSEAGAIVTQTMRVTADDRLSRHKTLNYWRKRIAHAAAAACGSDDALCITPDGLICETSRANIFLIERRRLITPDLDGPLLPRVMRGVVLDRAKRTGLDVDERPVPLERINTADEAFLTSSVRGILPIVRLLDRDFAAPGPVTQLLWSEILPWLETGGPRS